MAIRYFASDNNAGVHPEVLQALQAANVGHAVGYGADRWTERLSELFQQIFGPQASAYPVLTGTGANVLSLSAVLKPFEAVFCSQIAHLNIDECGAPERFLGSKLITLPAIDGKLQLADLQAYLLTRDDEHRVQPRVISITQPTEVGTLYSLDEIRQLADFAHSRDMLLHVDGARIANAVVALDTSFKAMLSDTGVDLLSFGATKNGLLCGEAVVFLRTGLDSYFKFLRKQGMQLVSKMRFVSSQLVVYLEKELWRDNALQANQMAQMLAEAVSEFPEISLAYPVQTNGVFAKVPAELIAPLQAQTYFYVWNEAESIVRWMTSFDTQPEDIDNFMGALRDLFAQRGSQ